MKWAGQRDNLEGDMTPLAGMPSSSEVYLKTSFVSSSIQMPDKIIILWIRDEKKQRNMISQRTLREALKVWRLMQL